MIKSIESIKFSYSIFLSNYSDLKTALEEHREKSDDGSLWSDDELRWIVQERIVRLMYNFFSSAFRLVNHNRKLYESSTVIAKEYLEYINNNFVSNPLHSFVIDFRNFLCHSSLPLIVSNKKYSNKTVKTTFMIRKDSILKFKWEPVARSYFDSLQETFDLGEIVDQNFHKVRDLHEWYKIRQLQFYRHICRGYSKEKGTIELSY